MPHPEFEQAGKNPGLQVWRVENLALKPVPPQCYGQFFRGDAYIVLYTSHSQSYNIHAWMGPQASQDEQGAAAIFMTQMDDHLGKNPRQFLEFEDSESTEFQRYFPHGIIYKHGGVASGFNHVVTNDNQEKRVLHIKGRRRIRGVEVGMSWDNFNRGDCFIVELQKDIYLWFGCECNAFERVKASEIAIDIRDMERMGRSEIHYVNENEEPERLLAALGPKPKTLPPASCDKAADIKNRKASLYMISNTSGSMTKTLVADSNPFKQDCLNSKECFILDNSRMVFIWKGKQANRDERSAAMTMGRKFVKDKGYPANTPISVLHEGCETPLFKQFFPCWIDKDESTSYTKGHSIGNIANVEQVPFDASQLHNNKQMAAHHGMLDDGSGSVQIWRVEGGDKEPVDTKLYGQFYGGDCYLILYSYKDKGAQKYVIYTWQGLKSSQDERGASAILTVDLDQGMGGVATQVRVIQGNEPAHLLSIFKDKPVIVFLGGTCRKWGDSMTGSTRLFHIRLKSNGYSYAVEVPPNSSKLNTNDIFVLKSPEGCFLWRGKGSKPEEMTAAKYVASMLGGNFSEIPENKEPASFWTALGGKRSYQTSQMLQNSLRSPKLFGCSNKTGRIIAEEVVSEISQSDLATDDVMILDAWEQIYVWIGKDSNECEKCESFKIAKQYIESDPAGRDDIPIITIKQGEEPPCFTGWFHAWDPKMWEKDLFSCMQARFKR